MFSIYRLGAILKDMILLVPFAILKQDACAKSVGAICHAHS